MDWCFRRRFPRTQELAVDGNQAQLGRRSRKKDANKRYEIIHIYTIYIYILYIYITYIYIYHIYIHQHRESWFFTWTSLGLLRRVAFCRNPTPPSVQDVPLLGPLSEKVLTAVAFYSDSVILYPSCWRIGTMHPQKPSPLEVWAMGVPAP